MGRRQTELHTLQKAVSFQNKVERELNTPFLEQDPKMNPALLQTPVQLLSVPAGAGSCRAPLPDSLHCVDSASGAGRKAPYKAGGSRAFIRLRPRYFTVHAALSPHLCLRSSYAAVHHCVLPSSRAL